MSRHWEITDEDGHAEEVRGTGLVGSSPCWRWGRRSSTLAGARRDCGDEASAPPVGQRRMVGKLRVGASAPTPSKAAA